MSRSTLTTTVRVIRSLVMTPTLTVPFPRVFSCIFVLFLRGARASLDFPGTQRRLEPGDLLARGPDFRRVLDLSHRLLEAVLEKRALELGDLRGDLLSGHLVDLV